MIVGSVELCDGAERASCAAYAVYENNRPRAVDCSAERRSIVGARSLERKSMGRRSPFFGRGVLFVWKPARTGSYPSLRADSQPAITLNTVPVSHLLRSGTLRVFQVPAVEGAGSRESMLRLLTTSLAQNVRYLTLAIVGTKAF